MVITEEELRQAWQNGRGRIPAFPPGTRFTPAAQDFLRTRAPEALQPPAPAQPAPAPAAGARRELQAPPGQRLIFTALEVPELLAGGPSILVLHPSVTVTHVALERLRKAGVRIVPWVEPSATPEPRRPSPPDPAAASQGELFAQAKAAVLARLGHPVDPTVLDAVLVRVLAAMKE